MTSNDALQKLVKVQESQILNYEKKLKDVVCAYKSLESEKKALEVALSTISEPVDDLATTTVDENNVGAIEEANESVPTNSANDTTTEITNRTSRDQLEALKQAISTLTIENKRKELAYQADRKSLLATKEKLTEELDGLKKKLAGDSDVERRLRAQLADVEAQRERMLNEHGDVVAEMQQRYAKERKDAAKIEEQLTQLSCRLQEKDDIIQSMEGRAKEYARMEQEIHKLRKKAAANPTAQVLKQELVNVKERYEEELSAVRSRHIINTSLLSEKDARISALEARIEALTEEGAAVAVENAALHTHVEELKAKLSEARRAKSSDKPSGPDIAERSFFDRNNLEKEPDTVLIAGIQNACRVLKTRNIDLLETFQEFLRARKSKEDLNNYKNESNICEFCELANSEKNNFKLQIADLQQKLDRLETTYHSTKEEYAQNCDQLKKRIAELEINQQSTLSQFSSESMTRVMEIEEELKCQEKRMKEIIEEKDKEIEYARNSLMALYSKSSANPIRTSNINCGTVSDPLDPEPPTFDGELREICESSLKNDSNGDSASMRNFRRQSSSVLSLETRNIFYEQEITRHKCEISELRNVVRLSELKVRDIEQAMLTKDIQYLQIVETLKEEIRILLGKLSLEKSETNLAYLRNIFMQLLNANSISGRKHILKAMAAVLKLTSTEMKRIETCNL